MANNDVAVVVPARLASTRLPGKLLAPVCGRPVLAWTLEALKRTSVPEHRLFVATGDAPIAQLARACGVAVLPTPAELPSGSHRVAVASKSLPPEVRWVINVQGDEPLFQPNVIDRILCARHASVDILTAVCPVIESEWRAPSTVKAIVDRTGRALWFSRSPLPQRLASAPSPDVRAALAADPAIRRHLGVYAFPRARMQDWLELPVADLAVQAGLEQLSPLLSGWFIQTADVERPPGPSVDTAADLEAVRAVLTARCSTPISRRE